MVGTRASSGLFFWLWLVLMLAAPSLRASEPGAAEAKRQYQLGMAHFNLGEFDQAVTAFEAAYRVLPDPIFLYDLAQAHRLAGHIDDALRFYRGYRRLTAHVKNRNEVDARIADLERLRASRDKVASTPPDSTLPPRLGDTRAHGEPASAAATNGEGNAAGAAPATGAAEARGAPVPASAVPTANGTTDAAARAAEATPVWTASASPRRPTPLYRRWWLWTAVGVVAVGLGVGLTQPQARTYPAVTL